MVSKDDDVADARHGPSAWVLMALGILGLMVFSDYYLDADPWQEDGIEGSEAAFSARAVLDATPAPTLRAMAEPLSLREELARERAAHAADRRAAADFLAPAPPATFMGVPTAGIRLEGGAAPAEVDQTSFKPRRKSKKEAAEDAPWASALKPMWGFQHNPSADVVMALGFGYRQREFARFISTLRGVGFPGDIVLAAGPPEKFQRGVADYLRGERVLAYQFTYSCSKGGSNKPKPKAPSKSHKRAGRRLLATPAGCQLTNWYEGGDTRGPRPLAISRYEMYRTWLSFYEPTSWGFVFDFRDTYFQRDPFALVDRSKKAPNLHLFAENRAVKVVGNCPFNGAWMKCFITKEQLKAFKNNSVVCSGSTMGSVPALKRYTERMVQQMDASKCHATAARTESDQGYHNYLYDSGELAKLPGVRVTHHEQGHGLVNTIGAMNGARVPKHMKGPLDTHWKIKDAEGYILDYDGQRSAVVHQWDRFYKECVQHIDRLVDEYSRRKGTAVPKDKRLARFQG